MWLQLDVHTRCLYPSVTSFAGEPGFTIAVGALELQSFRVVWIAPPARGGIEGLHGGTFP